MIGSTTDRAANGVDLGSGGLGSAPPDERLRVPRAYRDSLRESGLLGEHAVDAAVPVSGVPDREMAPPQALPAASGGVSPAEPDSLAEPVSPPDGRADQSGPPGEHPLLRGLMVELPPRGRAPDPEWQERWLEAARAVLALLYVRRGDAGR